MRKITVFTVFFFLCAGWIFAATSLADERWEFSNKVTKIKLDGVSGDIFIRPAKGSQGMVELEWDVHPEGNFTPKVDQDGRTLFIKEKWRGRRSSGSVEWTIYLPKGSTPPKIQISTASGALDCQRIAARIIFETASGDIELANVELGEDSDFNTASGSFSIHDMTISEDTRFSTASGDFDLEDLVIEDGCRFSTASGDIKCINCKCEDDVEFSSASGDVVIKDTEILGESGFSSASGDVAVYLEELPENDLSASSASGNVLFDVGDFGDDFTLVLIKRKNKGRISCPFEYSEEDTFRDHHVYERKIIRRGSGRPEIELRTASGKVIVRK